MACGRKSADATAIPLGRRLPGASSNLPGRPDLDTDPEARALSRESLAPSLFGLAPGGVCRAAGVTAGAVRSYRTVSPLPRQTLRTAAVCSLWHFPWARTRRMLSGTVCPRSPDFPPRHPPPHPPPLAGKGRVGAGAAVRPTDRGMDGHVSLARQGTNSKGRRAGLRCGRERRWSGCGRDWRPGPATCCGWTDRQCRRCVRDGNGAGMP